MANKAISTLAVGSSVYLNVGGVKKEFLVVHQGLPSSLYDASCDGTWLLMKDIYENRQWNSSDSNVYETSTVNTYLNGPFLGLFDSNIQGIIKQVKIPYRKGGGSGTDQSGANGLSCKVFLLSGPEVGWTSSDSQYFPQDGAKLSYFGASAVGNSKRIANYGGSAASWGLRSPSTYSRDSYMWFVFSDGSYSSAGPSVSVGIRPALILPSTTQVDDSGNVVPVDLTAHKTLINGTAYTVKGGKCMVNGTMYNILKGRTLIDGTGYDITFPSAVTMPVKGDLITMNLDGTDRLYRVLKIVDETTVEVFRVQTLDTALRYSGTAEYAGNDIDVALNQTYYNTLTTAAKNAIVPKDINQYSYANRGSYTDDHACALYYPENKWLRWHVGNRFVYTLDLEDVEEYFNSKYTSDDLNATFFQGYTISGDKRLWLRSASTSDDSMAIMITHGLYACVIQSYFQYDYGVLAAFQIDLSKIDFTIN